VSDRSQEVPQDPRSLLTDVSPPGEIMMPEIRPSHTRKRLAFNCCCIRGDFIAPGTACEGRTTKQPDKTQRVCQQTNPGPGPVASGLPDFAREVPDRVREPPELSWSVSAHLLIQRPIRLSSAPPSQLTTLHTAPHRSSNQGDTHPLEFCTGAIL
jgi:hypothetical protein